jgi:hypothetical protein
MKNGRIFDLVVWLLIVALGLIAAYVTFGVLSSEASGQFQQYSVGGAIAGAVVSWSILTSVYLQLRRSSTELRELRTQNMELQNKLIRGAPRPQGFDTEVAERQRIVLARPREWQPKGGTIFDLELPFDQMEKGDAFAAAFRCYFVPISSTRQSQEEYYEQMQKSIEEAVDYVHSYSFEMVKLGGGPSEVDSLKLIIRQFVKITMTTSRQTGQPERSWDIVPRNEFTGEIYFFEPSVVRVNQLGKVTFYVSSLRKDAICYINDAARETEVVDGKAYVTLLDEDVEYPQILTVAFENSDAAGLRSNVVALPVEKAVEEEGTGVLKYDDDIEARKSTENGVSETATYSEKVNGEEEQIVYQQIVRMTVVCYHEQLQNIYYFEFFDDVKDFKESSRSFNQILSSTRFLD